MTSSCFPFPHCNDVPRLPVPQVHHAILRAALPNDDRQRRPNQVALLQRPSRHRLDPLRLRQRAEELAEQFGISARGSAQECRLVRAQARGEGRPRRRGGEECPWSDRVKEGGGGGGGQVGADAGHAEAGGEQKIVIFAFFRHARLFQKDTLRGRDAKAEILVWKLSKMRETKNELIQCILP